MSGILQALLASFPSGLAGFSLYAWGRNTYGPLGLNNTTNYSSPVQVGAESDWFFLHGGFKNSFGIKTDSSLYAWGQNTSGKLGDGYTNAVSSPVQIGALTNWQSVSSGAVTTLFVKTDGTLWGTGGNGFGQRGDGVGFNISSPSQIGALTNWAQVSTSRDNFSGAVKTDGSLWTWGRNFNGQLGHEDTIDRSSPVWVGYGTTGWAQFKTFGTASSIAIKTTGSIWAWGINNNGELGLGDTNERSSPVQIGALTNWSSAEPGQLATIALKTDGTLWSWGSGSNGRTGHGDNTSRSSPTQVGALSTWQTISFRWRTPLALKTDGTLWAWGYAGYGSIGNGVDSGLFYSPVQVGADTNWVYISAGEQHSLAGKSA